MKLDHYLCQLCDIIKHNLRAFKICLYGKQKRKDARKSSGRYSESHFDLVSGSLRPTWHVENNLIQRLYYQTVSLVKNTSTEKSIFIILKK